MKKARNFKFQSQNKDIQIEKLIEDIIQREKEILVMTQQKKDGQLLSWLDDTFGGYDYISLNGSEELNRKINFYVGARLNNKEIDSIIKRINKSVKLWLVEI